jgi:two-component system NtrC family sensor kinase
MARSVELKAELASNIPPILADPDQLQQVFINLISNSLDAMPGGGRLTVATSLRGQNVEIEVCDSGEGITRDQLETIFDPFFSTKEGRGTGLGLTIVKQIISEHRGHLEVESEPGRLTRFRIQLPVEPSAETADAAAALVTTSIRE